MAMKQLTIIPTGTELFMFERAYSKEAELGDETNYVNIDVARPKLMSEAIRYSNRLVMPRWRRTIVKADKGTDLSRNYPIKDSRMSIPITEEEYDKLNNFAYRNNMTLIEAALLLIRNYTALIYEDPTILDRSNYGLKRSKGIDNRKGLTLRLDPAVYEWFTMQAVKKDMTTGGFIRQTLNRVYTKNTGININDPRDQ